MYSFTYDESETWKVWPNGMSLSAFNDSSSSIVISQIVRQLLDDIRDETDELQKMIENDKSQLTNYTNQLLTAADSYLADVEINEAFVR